MEQPDEQGCSGCVRCFLLLLTCVQVASEGLGCGVNARSVSQQGPGLLAVHTAHV